MFGIPLLFQYTEKFRETRILNVCMQVVYVDMRNFDTEVVYPFEWMVHKELRDAHFIPRCFVIHVFCTLLLLHPSAPGFFRLEITSTIYVQASGYGENF